MDRIGLFTGSFDPLTLGHMDLIIRASRLFDRLLVGIFHNPQKTALLSIKDRQYLLKEAVAIAALKNVEIIIAQEELVVEVARRYGATSLVRGLRGGNDLSYEASYDFYNRNLAPELETVYLLAKPDYQFVSSSGVKELLAFKADISAYVPENVRNVLENQNENKKDE